MPNTFWTVGSLLATIGGMLFWYNRRRLWMSKSNVKNKVVLITGASSGLGEACAHSFHKAGAKLILCARRLQQLERVKKDLMSLKVPESHEPQILTLDLEDMDSLPKKARSALAIHGHIDILINNGGISYRGKVIDTDLSVHMQVMNVNYFGQVALTKAILPSMICHKSGHIVAISSIQGKIATPYRSAYTASKHALQAFCDTLRAEIADDNIHVSVISPGYINTSLSLNAVIGDGSKYGVMDITTAQGLSSSVVAERVLQAVLSNVDEVLEAQTLHKIAVWFRNILPNVFFAQMKARARKQSKEFNKKKST